MSSVSFIKFKLFLIILFQLFFGCHLPLLHPKRLIVLRLLTGAFSLVLLTRPNHLSLVSLILSSIGATPTFALKIPTFLATSKHVFESLVFFEALSSGENYFDKHQAYEAFEFLKLFFSFSRDFIFSLGNLIID